MAKAGPLLHQDRAERGSRLGHIRARRDQRWRARNGHSCAPIGETRRRSDGLVSCRLPAGATPASAWAANPRESGPAIRPPSPAGGAFDRRKVLRRAVDVAGPARGLRGGRQGRRSRNQQSDRQSPCHFAHRFLSIRVVVTLSPSAHRLDTFLAISPIGGAAPGWDAHDCGSGRAARRFTAAGGNHRSAATIHRNCGTLARRLSPSDRAARPA